MPDIRLSPATAQLVESRIDTMIRTHGLSEAMSDGRATMDEVDMPLDTYRSLTGNADSITRSTLRNHVIDGLMEEFRQKFNGLAAPSQGSLGQSVFENYQIENIEFKAYRDYISVSGLTVGFDRRAAGGPAEHLTHEHGAKSLTGALAQPFNAIDTNGDNAIDIKTELGTPAAGLTFDGFKVHNPASPIRTTRDVIRLAGHDGQVSLSDVFNYVINHVPAAQGTAAPGAAAR